MAERHPESSFVGLDYSRRQIAAARQASALVGLKNIEWLAASIGDIDGRLGEFDYIICHGVFSWVSRDVQEQILEVCRANLKPQGVAYVSYNVYPGWHLRGVVRDLLLGCSSASDPPKLRVERGRKLVDFLIAALASDPTPYARLMLTELEVVRSKPTSICCTNTTKPTTTPAIFTNSPRADAHGLQYLGEATVLFMFPANFASVVEQNLLRIVPEVIANEQHMDVLRNRAFRQTLLCHRDVRLTRQIGGAKLEGMFFAGQLTAVDDPAAVTPESEPTENPRIFTSSATIRAALRI